MSKHSDKLSLIKVHTGIQVVVAAKDYDDAEKTVRENYGDIVYDMYKNDKDVLAIYECCTIHELHADSPLRDYYPHGDEYGGQYTCEYYTTVEKDKRAQESKERQDKIQSLIGDLDNESLELLRNHFISDEY